MSNPLQVETEAMTAAGFPGGLPRPGHDALEKLHAYLEDLRQEQRTAKAART